MTPSSQSAAPRAKPYARKPPAPKAAMGFKQEVRKDRSIKRSVEEGEEPVTVRVKGKDVSVTPTARPRQRTLSESITTKTIMTPKSSGCQ